MGQTWVRDVRDRARARSYDEDADEYGEMDDLGRLCERALGIQGHPGCDHYHITEGGIFDGVYGGQRVSTRNWRPPYIEGLQRGDGDPDKIHLCCDPDELCARRSRSGRPL